MIRDEDGSHRDDADNTAGDHAHPDGNGFGNAVNQGAYGDGRAAAILLPLAWLSGNSHPMVLAQQRTAVVGILMPIYQATYSGNGQFGSGKRVQQAIIR